MSTLDGKVAIISGAATGIGRATALVFAAAGARLMLTDVRPAELEKTTADVKAAGGAVASVVADFARPEAPASVVEAAVRAWGRRYVRFIVVGGGDEYGGCIVGAK